MRRCKGEMTSGRSDVRVPQRDWQWKRMFGLGDGGPYLDNESLGNIEINSSPEIMVLGSVGMELPV